MKFRHFSIHSFTQIILLPLLYKTAKPRTAANKKNSFHLQSLEEVISLITERSDWRRIPYARPSEPRNWALTSGVTWAPTLANSKRGQKRPGPFRTPPGPNPAADAPRTHCRSPRAVSPGLQATHPDLTPHPADKTSCKLLLAAHTPRPSGPKSAHDQGVRPGLFLETPETAAPDSATRTYLTPLGLTQTCSKIYSETSFSSPGRSRQS